MDFRSSIAFYSDEDTLSKIEDYINNEYILEEFVESYDYEESKNSEILIYRVETSNGNSINIYELQRVLLNHIENVDVIYALTDTKTFIDVISTSGNYDTHVDDDITHIEELCSMYNLEFYGESYEDLDETDEDDYDNY